MTKAITKNEPITPDAIDTVIAKGDLSKLTADERVSYYRNVCESVGLNPMTRPFEYITLQGKLTLYARKDATDQMRKLHGVSIQIVSRETINGVYVVTARGTDKHGRFDESIGAVTIAGKSGDDACNALMKAETKAKRRVTLSLCGMGWLDESEVETIPSARVERYDHDTGELMTAAAPQPQQAPVKTFPKSDNITRKALHALSLPDCDLSAWTKKVVKYVEDKELSTEDQLRLNVALNDVKFARQEPLAIQEEAS